MFSLLQNKPRRRKPTSLTGKNRSPETDPLLDKKRNILDDLFGSGNKLDWQQTLMGFSEYGHRPILQNRSVFNENMIILGGAGSGKSAYAAGLIEQLTTQSRLARQFGGQTCSIVMLDFKPSEGIFHLVKNYAERDDGQTEPLPFRWFDLSSLDTPTHLFNPMAQKFYQRLSPDAQGAFHAMSAGFDMGSGYGKDWFSVCLYEAFLRIVQHEQPHSYGDLAKYAVMPFKQLACELQLDRSDMMAMRHCTLLAGQVARFPQSLPSLKNRYGVSDDVINSAIDMTDVVSKHSPQVVYFRLNSIRDSRSSRVMGSYAIASAMSAASHIHRRERHPVYFFVDEAHIMAEEKNIQHWIAMARELGICLVLISQSIAQWPLDCRELLLNSTGCKVMFDANDPTQRQVTQDLTGTKTAHRTTHSVNHSYEVDSSGGGTLERVTEGVSRSEVDVPGISVNELIRIGHQRDLGVMCINREVPNSYTKVDGKAFAFRRTYPLTGEAYAAISNLDVPKAHGTFVPADVKDLMINPQAARQPRTRRPKGNQKRISGEKANAMKLLEEVALFDLGIPDDFDE